MLVVAVAAFKSLKSIKKTSVINFFIDLCCQGHNFRNAKGEFTLGTISGGGRVRNAGLPVITGNTLLAVACEYCRRAPSDFGCLRGSRVQPRQGSDSSRRARDTAATMLDHSRHRGESATKTVKFFAAHTVNCVISKNLTRIEWMLLNFTPVIQQNCHQPGRNFEKSFCAVDRLSCQNPKPAASEAILFLIVNYVHVILWHGAKCCFEIFKEFRLLCCWNFMGH